MKLVLATKNAGKLKELVDLAGGSSWLKVELAPAEFDPEETGNTFLENAIIKAREAAVLTGKLALADDSGLAVDALGGAPGIYSARYCQGTDADRRHKLLIELKDVPTELRQAKFVCAMALCSPKGEVLHTSIGIWNGVIAQVEKGVNGFGYDPIFYPAAFDRTAAELSSEEKNERSHRAQAWAKMSEFLKSAQIHLDAN